MHAPSSVPEKLAQNLDKAVELCKGLLGERLISLSLYGSAVRGGHGHALRSLNILLVVERANTETLQIIGDVVKQYPMIDPFVLEADGLEGDFRAFAPKFASIRRNYRLLHGEDVLASFEAVPALERFLIEQSLRNLRLRLGQAYLRIAQAKPRRFGKKPRFENYLIGLTPTVFTQLSTVLRYNGIAVPNAYGERTALIETLFGAGNGVLADLLTLKAKPRALKPAQVTDYFDRLHRLLGASLQWMEEKWPLQLSA